MSAVMGGGKPRVFSADPREAFNFPLRKTEEASYVQQSPPQLLNKKSDYAYTEDAEGMRSTMITQSSPLISRGQRRSSGQYQPKQSKGSSWQERMSLLPKNSAYRSSLQFGQDGLIVRETEPAAQTKPSY